MFVSGRELKWKKWKAIKKELYVAFISKNIILRESLTVRKGKMVTSNGREGSENQWQICNERVKKVGERKERRKERRKEHRKEGTYVKRGM